jgi:hypothetical protein
MSTRPRSAQILQRKALLVALVCFWISSGATLRHTDPPLFFFAGHSTTGHATPPPTQLPCAACEWEQAFSTTHPPSVQIICAPLIRTRYADGLPTALHLRSFDYVALRGPPA